MPRRSSKDLTRREAQIMDILYRRGRAAAAVVQRDLPDPPGYSAVRKLLEILEEKGHVEHEYEGPRHVYYPTVPLEVARASALLKVVHTFFDGSVSRAAAALLALHGKKPSADELDRIARLADDAGRDGR
jgi:predicted transcriptional regulator